MSRLSPDLAPLAFRNAQSSEPIEVVPKRLVVAGYTGRDDANVQAHIRELEAAGIAPPPNVPMFYELPVDLLTSASTVTVPSAATSGEVEAVLICREDGWWVAVGSDHTERELERKSIAASKAACPKIVSREVLRVDALLSEWDAVQIRSWVTKDGVETPYQYGTLGELLSVRAMLGEVVPMRSSDLDGMVLFLGTVPLLTDGFLFGDSYRMELRHPGSLAALGMTYDVQVKEKT